MALDRMISTRAVGQCLDGPHEVFHFRADFASALCAAFVRATLSVSETFPIRAISDYAFGIFAALFVSALPARSLRQQTFAVFFPVSSVQSL